MALESETFETLEAATLQLSPAERARLVDRFIAALDADPEVEEAWAAEVDRCRSQVETGAVSLLPGPETLAKLKPEFECLRHLRHISTAVCDHLDTYALHAHEA